MARTSQRGNTTRQRIVKRGTKVKYKKVWIWGGPERSQGQSFLFNLILDPIRWNQFLAEVCNGNNQIASEIVSSYVSNLLEQHTFPDNNAFDADTYQCLRDIVTNYSLSDK
jgi:hypothetical protein